MNDDLVVVGDVSVDDLKDELMALDNAPIYAKSTHAERVMSLAVSVLEGFAGRITQLEKVIGDDNRTE